MHPHEAQYGVKVRGARAGAPCGPSAQQDPAFLRRMSQKVGGRMPIGGGSPIATESELVDLRKEITKLDGEADQLHADAEKLVDGIRASGVDPLMDKDAFDKVDEAFKLADEKRQDAFELRKRADRVMQSLGVSPDRKETRTAGQDESPRVGALRLGENFVESETFTKVKELAGKDLRAAAAYLMGNPTEVLSADDLEVMLRAVTTPASPSALIPPDTRPPVLGIPMPTKILDLITVGQTDSDTVEYVIEVLQATAAAETIEGDPAVAASGILPESNFVFQEGTTTTKRIGHWTPVREKTLQNASQLRTILNTRLREGVLRRTEAQVIAGNGTGENIRGILNTTGINTVTMGSVGFETENALDALHRGITQCRLAEVEPNGVAIHPVDYEQDVVLLKDLNENYLFKIGEPASIWGKPAAITTAVTQNTAIVGAFEHAVLLVATALQVLASTEHADFFLRALVALKAEYRAAFYVDRPAAFTAVTGI